MIFTILAINICLDFWRCNHIVTEILLFIIAVNKPFFHDPVPHSVPQNVWPIPYMDHPGFSSRSDRRHDEQKRRDALGNSKPS